MISDEAAQNFSSQIHEFWVLPEVERRRNAGELPDDFHIYRCLIRLPQGRPPVVEFNDEVAWVAHARRGDGELFVPGENIYLYEIDEIYMVDPPEIAGKRVAFVYIFWDGFSYQCCFDFSPNWPESEQRPDLDNWEFGEVIAQHLQALMVEGTINQYNDVKEQLYSIGLWAAPALLPYPLGKIITQLRENDVSSARKILIAHCNPSFVRRLMDNWWDIESFEVRRNLFEEAFDAHSSGHYHLSIHTLLPHTEGVITDWEYSFIDDKDTIPFRTESKTKKFRDLLSKEEQTTFTYRVIVDSASTFMLDGPVLRSFKKWVDDLDLAFPNRHVIGHGRYYADIYTEESSIKVFLLIDTIYGLIKANS